MAGMRSSLQGSAEGALSCSAWLFVLACLQDTDLETVSEASSRAVQIAEDYMKAVADKVKSLMLRVSEVSSCMSSLMATHACMGSRPMMGNRLRLEAVLEPRLHLSSLLHKLGLRLPQLAGPL